MERASMLMEGAGLERSKADAAALREFGFNTWETLASAQRELDRCRTRLAYHERGGSSAMSDFGPSIRAG
jgi:hypothetical protein